MVGGASAEGEHGKHLGSLAEGGGEGKETITNLWAAK